MFPSSYQYVCFEELGTSAWNKKADLLTLFLSLHTEIKHNAKEYNEGVAKEMTRSEEESHLHWKFVADAHKDWQMKDVKQLTDKMSSKKLKEIREKAQQEVAEIREKPAKREAVEEPKQEVEESKQEVAAE